ncbi:hypothetical protein [Streptomyces sp. A1499]|uniref:hypothetical protein n=1 Tax=Streptomyces sp. A1499 TaxID=2563104 RepID=UPI00109E7CAB|nr:hypothetical protein [Streptomyces sp. A1499]THC45172.1 hypothetical protein E7X58_32430 [Streptomyces sp. A1499]
MPRMARAAFSGDARVSVPSEGDLAGGPAERLVEMSPRRGPAAGRDGCLRLGPAVSPGEAAGEPFRTKCCTMSLRSPRRRRGRRGRSFAITGWTEFEQFGAERPALDAPRPGERNRWDRSGGMA